MVPALLLVCAYAAFARGAVDDPSEARLQAGLALIALWAAGAWLMTGPPPAVRLRAAPAGWWGLGLLAAFGAFSAVTLFWSVAPDDTWIAVNRALAYTLVVAVAIAAGTSSPRALERLALGWLAVATAVALWALLHKVAPSWFDDTGIARLRAPLDDWNALGLVCAMGVPVAIRLATDAARRPTLRLAGLAAGLALVCALGMTYSRSAVVALVVALVVLIALGGPRLRGLAAAGLLALAAAPVLTLAFTRAGLKDDGVAISERAHDGRVLLAVLVLCLAALVAAGIGLARVERRTRPRPRRERATWLGLAAVGGVAIVAVVVALAASDRGLGGSLSHAWDSFTGVEQPPRNDPGRLTSTTSGNRWLLWEEAAGAWSDRPFGGWGAGSFPVTHRLYRDDDLPAQQAHSAPLGFLAETGAIGAVMALAALVALFAAALARARRLESGRERDLATALLAAAAAWAAQALIDRSWEVPALTIPALAFLGVLAARPGRPRAPALGEPEPAGPAARGAALVGVTALLLAFAASAILPSWSQSTTDSARDLAAPGATPDELQRAAARADLAASLDPVATGPLLAGADIAQARGRFADARHDLLEAAARQPYDTAVWAQLTQLALALADRQGAVDASQRLLELDPAGSGARDLAARAAGALAPPGASATATGTPLPPG